MTDSARRSEQEKMVQAGLISAEDNVIDGVQINHISGPLGTGVSSGWWAYFTDENLVLLAGAVLGIGKMYKSGTVIPYKNIKEIKRCPYVFFFSGTAISYEDPKTGSLSTERIYFGPGGSKWKSLLAEKTGISLA